MTSSLSVRQGLLTRSIHRLSSVIRSHEDLLAQSGIREDEEVEDRARRIRRAIVAIEAELGTLESSLEKYAKAADSLDAELLSSSEISQRIDTNIEAAQELLDQAQQALTTLTVLQRGTEPLEVPSVSGSPQISEVKLAPVPVPKFSGEIWEWETFWKTFEHTIHSKNIDNIYKLNYLMDALQGAAKQSVEQFQVSSETYPLVVAHLKKKYGDTQALVDRLLNKLQSAKANSDSLEDQETLCEQLLSITSQLDLHGEHIDNTFLQRELLGKFSIDVQRQILRQKPKLKTEETWSTMALLRTAKEFVEAELRIIRQVKSHSSNNKRKRDTSGMEERKSPLSRNFAKNQLAPCFYCGKTGHLAKNCTEISSLDQRLEIIKAQKLCRNCGQKDHTAAKCTKGACRACGITGHHTSICKTLFPQNNLHTFQNPRKQTEKSTELIKSTNVNTAGFAKDTNSKQETVPDCSSHDNVMLLTGQAKVLNPTTGALESIHIMLGTGADRSFISDELADRLQLTNVDTTELTINTFASQKPMKRTCRNTVMKLWDVDGNQHTFTVTRIGTITPTLARSSLSEEDKKFIYENEIHLSIDPSIKKVQPTVLLGCADLFSILGNGLQKQYTLPSGLKVIPSKLGYLISGRSKLQQDDVGKPPVQTIHQVDTQPIRQKPQLSNLLDVTKTEQSPTTGSSFSTSQGLAESPAPSIIPDPFHPSPLPLQPPKPPLSPTLPPHPVLQSPPPPPTSPIPPQPTTPRPPPSTTQQRDEEKAYVQMIHKTKNQADSIPTTSTEQSWEQFFEFERTGSQEFTGPASQERKLANDAIWKAFEESIEKKADGYYVRLPWKPNSKHLPDNKQLAYRRLKANLIHLAKNETILHQYHNTIMDQLERGIIEEVRDEQTSEGEIVHYLAHHAVITPQKETTKLRIVFDASAHLKNCPSLNDVLNQGPVILPKICDILLRFRIGDTAIISDIEKAFLQVRLHPSDRNATRFMWIRNIRKPLNQANLVTYRFTRVTFGLNCSPFLLAGTISHHLRTMVEDTHLAKDIEDNIYVDNLILTTSSTNEALKVYEDTKRIFNELNMNLRQFQSNNSVLKDQIAPIDLCTSDEVKVLGITWNTRNDQITLKCRYPKKENITKRSVSEQVAAVYDPLGWLTPLTLAGKRFLQQLWKFNYQWDSALSKEHQTQWKNITESIEDFFYTIPRKVAQIGTRSRLVLFSDASTQAMATCAYIVSSNEANLITGKAKLSPIKERMTVPKLELNALTIATRLAHSIFSAIHHRTRIEEVILLSDSEIALSWLNSHPIERTVGVLVKNRVEEVRRIVSEISAPVRLGYVNSTDNPADCATRGVDKNNFINHIWWKGPTFIKKPLTEWPETCQLFVLPSNNEGMSNHILTTLSSSQNNMKEILDWKRHNTTTSIKIVMAYVLRFIKNLISKTSSELQSRITSTIPELRRLTNEKYVTAIERKASLQVIVRNHQMVHFQELQLNSLKQLKIRRDKYGILRCRGRMENADLPFEARQPILIAAKSELAKIIVQEAHSPLHCTTAHTIANVRNNYWIPKLRQLVQIVIRKCIPCQKMNNLPYKYPEMEDLPKRRVQRARPFEHVGIDYFGPISAKEKEEVTQVYGIIITCTTTRLLHLELVPDMTTTNLLNALRRFFARRGIPATITSDNAPNFLLAEQVLSDAVRSITQDPSFINLVASKGVEWRTITPFAPWQGAFYERLIKSVKYTLYKVTRKTVLTKTDLETVLTEIEGTLNSRPLTYQEENWEETPILRPIDFIQRDIIVTYPFETCGTEHDDEEYLPSNEMAQLRTRQQAEQALKKSHQMTEKFWSIWRSQYLTSLREKHKLLINNRSGTRKIPTRNTVVLVHDPILPRNTWKVGRIHNLLSSVNGTIREAQVKLPSGRIIRRPINLLIPLELQDEETQESTTQETNRRGEVLQSQLNHYNLRPRLSHQQDELRLDDLQNSTTNQDHTSHHTSRVSTSRYGSSGTPHQFNQQMVGPHNVGSPRSIENHSLLSTEGCYERQEK